MRRLGSVLVTGANGFVGRTLVLLLRERGHQVREATRSTVGEIGPETDWRAALEGIDAVVHLAARVHVMQENAADAEAAYDRVNRAGTARLAEQAADAGVRRLVFLSTVKVNGEATSTDAFRETDLPSPQDAYGRSKLAAEEALAAIAAAAGLQCVALRSPLVYGPGVRANFAALLGLCASPWPLPLGLARNRRSLVFIGNLADAVARCLERDPPHRFAAYFVRDGEDLSTVELVRHLRAALGRSAGLLPVPPGLLRAAARLADRTAVTARLLGSLQVDDRLFRRDLAWKAPIPAEDGLAATARWFAEARRERKREGRQRRSL